MGFHIPIEGLYSKVWGEFLMLVLLFDLLVNSFINKHFMIEVELTH